MDPRRRQATSTYPYYCRYDLSHITSSPLWRPEKRTDNTNTQEAKLKHTIHTDRRKETNTQRGREGDERLNFLEDKDPDLFKTSRMRHYQSGEREREREVPGQPMVQHRQA